MIIAGEPSGDLLAAELVKALQMRRGGIHPRFFGAGGVKMAEAGVELAFDMTRHSVIGLWEVVKRYGTFKRLFDQLLALALERKPDALLCVDFSGFNRRFAAALRWELQLDKRGAGWRPRIVQFVSPQVWASRPGRARQMARDFDLLLSIFPFEKAWYAEHEPALRVEFVGHPMVDRFQKKSTFGKSGDQSVVLLLPGSRTGELKRHLPAMLAAARLMSQRGEWKFQMALPNETLVAQAREQLRVFPELKVDVQAGGLSDALSRAAVAIASTGTVTMECAFFGVPTVTLYKTSWATYQIGKRIVKVSSLTMPNLLAGSAVFPEFIQDEATAENISRAALELLTDAGRREGIRKRLTQIVATLGGEGACSRAAQAIWRVME